MKKVFSPIVSLSKRKSTKSLVGMMRGEIKSGLSKAQMQRNLKQGMLLRKKK